MTSVQQETKTSNAVTLKGSAKLVSEFFNFGINSILYQRGVYPAESFTRYVGKVHEGLKLGIGNFLVYDFWTPQAPTPPRIELVHGCDRKFLNLT